jgi:hypothetical protein
MSNNKNFTIIKTVPGTVLFTVHPISNPALGRIITLTDRNPKQALPTDWAMGVFANPGVYGLYKSKKFTFDDNDGAVKAAFELGVYFDDKLDFTPAKPNRADAIFATLNSGNRSAIMDIIESDGVDAVKSVAITRANELTTGVVKMLEQIFKIQLTVDGE